MPRSSKHWSRAQRTGEGALIRVSLFDATAEWMAVPLIHFDMAAARRRGWARASLGGALRPVSTADGKEILIAIQNEREWRRFCADILGDAGSPTTRASATTTDGSSMRRGRRAGRRGVRSPFAHTLAERLKSAGIAFGNFNTVEDFSHHPHLRRIAVETPQGAVGCPPLRRCSRTSGQLAEFPALGEHTAAVRAEFAR